ncbi:unnamed protein product [marine sediment metagenome]|uniref:Uncharacterized protein n=1 Tax=marine sediment metagenome TaxID=412755 RepID=X1K505_9ZZZZ
MSLTPIIIPVTIDGLRYWTKFEKIFERIDPSMYPWQALTLGISLIGFVLGGIILLAGGGKR